MPAEKKKRSPRQTPGINPDAAQMPPAAKRKKTAGQPAPEPETPGARPAAAKKQTARAPRAKARTESEPQARASGTTKPAGRAASSSEAKSRPLSVVMISPEAHPFAKTGGLAEVAGALPAALGRLGHSVTLILPRYRGATLEAPSRRETTLRLGDRSQVVAFDAADVANGVKVVLVDVPELFDREALYGTAAGDYPDNAWRFAVFSRAALEYIRLQGERPSAIHAHDWQTGLVPVYQKMHLPNDPIVGGVPVVFTIHNLAFQGLFPSTTLAGIGLGWEVMDVQAMEYWGQISYLKAGINFSEKITTVSPNYAREITGPELGFGFEGVLARRSGDLIGILNGIDTDRWEPAADEFVPASFSADDLSGKREAKKALLAAVGLPSDAEALDRPVIGSVSRLTDQKGFDLVADAADDLMTLDATWVMLGSGEPRYERLWRTLASRFPDRVSTTVGFDERLAHLIEAGADMFLMPSRFEPCGLNQLYSLRYGTVPIVRATGGLDDTVENVDDASGAGTGFKFRDYSPGALVATVRRALDVFGNPEVWTRIQQEGMRLDHSWNASAREYVKVYGALLKGGRHEAGVTSALSTA